MGKRFTLGVTGTRYGMTTAQRDWAIDYIETFKPDRFRHGCCVGVDEQMHHLVTRHSPLTKIVVHPPVDLKWAALELLDAQEPHVFIQPARGYHERNRDIVDASLVLLAFPREMEEQETGGTWYTVRYAADRIPCRIVYPDGSEELRDVED